MQIVTQLIKELNKSVLYFNLYLGENIIKECLKIQYFLNDSICCQVADCDISNLKKHLETLHEKNQHKLSVVALPQKDCFSVSYKSEITGTVIGWGLSVLLLLFVPEQTLITGIEKIKRSVKESKFQGKTMMVSPSTVSDACIKDRLLSFNEKTHQTNDTCTFSTVRRLIVN